MSRTILALFIWLITTMSVAAETVRLAVTTSFENAGLADVLLPRIAADTGLSVQLLVVGTGQALRLGAAGDVDALLVHAKAAEEAFVAAGHATHRREIMYNDFVLVGPGSDPANVKTADTIDTAFTAVAQAEATFVSRGDNSGTHQAELNIWAATGQDHADFGDWYKSVGAGMGATLNTAAGLNGYVLSDRATWLNFGNKAGLEILFSDDPALFNQYSFLPINPARHPHVATGAVARLEDWLTSPAAKETINAYRVSGEQLFTFNASAQ